MDKIFKPKETKLLTPPSPNVNAKQRVRDRHALGFDLWESTRLNPWKKKTTLKFGGRGR